MVISADFLQDVLFTNYLDCFKKSSDSPVKYICEVENCGSTLSSKTSAIRHLGRKHKNIHEHIDTNKNKVPENRHNSAVDIKVAVDPNAIKQACVNLVTINGLPLNILDQPNFQSLIEPYKTALRLIGISLTINRSNIKDEIEKRASRMKQIIVGETQNRLLCLMIDIASRYNRAVLGVNIKYMIGGKSAVRTIGMHVLRCSHTADNIVLMIKKNLLEFGISLSQLIAGTTDNGKNMLKAIAMLDAEFQDQDQSAHEENDEESDIDDEIFDEEYWGHLLNNVIDHFQLDHTDLIYGVSCAAHCIHLILTHAIDECVATKELVEKCRVLARKLRTPTFNEMLRSKKMLAAKIDMKTRWNSIFSMVRQQT